MPDLFPYRIFSRLKGQRGGVLLTTLVVTMLTVMLAMGAAYEAGMDLKTTHQLGDATYAIAMARAGLETGVYVATKDAAMRAAPTDYTLFADRAIGEGRVTVVASDPSDGQLRVRGEDLSSDIDTMRLAATVKLGNSSRGLRADYVPLPHVALRQVIFAENKIELDNVWADGRIRSNDNVKDLGHVSVRGNITVLDGKSIDASLDDDDTDFFYDSAKMDFPAPDFEWYRAAGEQISLPIDKRLRWGVYTKTYNSGGSVSAEGIYWMDAGGADVRMDECIVEGTLAVIDCNHLFIGRDSPSRFVLKAGDPSRYPVLLVDGKIEMDIEGGSVTAYRGLTAVTVACEVDGVIYANDSFKGPQFKNATTPLWIEGAVIAKEVLFKGPGTRIRHDAELNTNALASFVGEGFRCIPGSVRGQ